MDYNQMKYEFQLKYDALAGLQAPPYNDKEMSVLLTWAQEKILKQRLNPSPLNNNDSFEETEKRKSEFDQWVSSGVVTTFKANDPLVNHPYGIFLYLPTDFLYCLSERADLKFKVAHDCYAQNSIIKDVKVKPITHDYYIDNIISPFKKPYEELIWRLNVASDKGGSKMIELITDKNTEVYKYYVRYIKRPKPIIVGTGVTLDGYSTPLSCELDAMIHREIITLAVEDAIEISKDTQRFQSFKIQNQIND